MTRLFQNRAPIREVLFGGSSAMNTMPCVCITPLAIEKLKRFAQIDEVLVMGYGMVSLVAHTMLIEDVERIPNDPAGVTTDTRYVINDSVPEALQLKIRCVWRVRSDRAPAYTQADRRWINTELALMDYESSERWLLTIIVRRDGEYVTQLDCPQPNGGRVTYGCFPIVGFPLTGWNVNGDGP